MPGPGTRRASVLRTGIAVSPHDEEPRVAEFGESTLSGGNSPPKRGSARVRPSKLHRFFVNPATIRIGLGADPQFPNSYFVNLAEEGDTGCETSAACCGPPYSRSANFDATIPSVSNVGDPSSESMSKVCCLKREGCRCFTCGRKRAAFASNDTLSCVGSRLRRVWHAAVCLSTAYGQSAY